MSSWSSSHFSEWINSAENIKKQLDQNDLKKLSSEEFENNVANFVRSTAEQLYNSENENSREFSIKEITSALRKSGEIQDKIAKVIEEDIAVIRVDQSNADQSENNVDNTIIDKYIQLSENIQNKIREIVIADTDATKGDANAIYMLFNLKYLVLPKEQVKRDFMIF